MYDPSGSLYSPPQPPGSHPDPLNERGLGRQHSNGRKKKRWTKGQWGIFFTTIVYLFLMRNCGDSNSSLTETENKNDSHRIEQEVADLDQAILLKPDNAQAWFRRGGAKYKLGQYEEALVDFDKAIAFDPAYTSALLMRGIVKHELDQYREALADFDQAINFDPDNADAFLLRGMTQYHLGQGEEGLADMKAGLRLAQQAGDSARIERAENVIQRYGSSLPP